MTRDLVIDQVDIHECYNTDSYPLTFLMVQKTFGEIVRQSLGISSFIGIAIVLAGNLSGNPGWYQGSYGISDH